MTLTSDAKFEEKVICGFKNDKNLVNFDPSTQKSQKFALCTLQISFCAKYITFNLKNTPEYNGPSTEAPLSICAI